MLLANLSTSHRGAKCQPSHDHRMTAERWRWPWPTVIVGFTLVELLVTLGVVAVLLALLIPATVHVRRQSQATVCASNLRQTATALLTYVQENGKGRVPRGAIDFNTTEPLWVEAVGDVMLSGRSWQWADLQRLKSLHCPSHPVTEFVSSHFLMNAFAFDSEPLWRHSPPVVWSRIKQPSEVPMLVEAADSLGSARFVLGDLYFEPALMIWRPEHLPGSPRERIGHRRHGSRSNLAFFDGHVDSRRSGDWTLSLFDDGIRDRWGGSGPPR